MTHVNFDVENSQGQVILDVLLEVSDSLALLHDLIPRDSDQLILSPGGTDGLRLFVGSLQKKLDVILGSQSSSPIGGQGGGGRTAIKKACGVLSPHALFSFTGRVSGGLRVPLPFARGAEYSAPLGAA